MEYKIIKINEKEYPKKLKKIYIYINILLFIIINFSEFFNIKLFVLRLNHKDFITKEEV